MAQIIDVNVKKSSIISLDQLVAEGRGRFATYSGNNFTATPGTVVAGVQTNTGLGFNVLPLKEFIATSIVVTCDGPGMVRMAITPANSWSSYIIASGALPYQGNLFCTFGANGGSQSFSYEKGFRIYEDMQAIFYYLSANTTARNVSFAATGIEIQKESNWNPKFRIGIKGDSISIGGNLGNDAGGKRYLGDSHWSTVFRNQCVANGIDAGVIANNGEDGKTALEGYYNSITGKNNFSCDLLFYMYGMNDAADANFALSTEAKFKEALQYEITWRNANDPNRKICFLGPSSSDAIGRSARLPNYRSWMLDVVTANGGGSNGLFYVDASQAFALNADPALDVNIKNTERAAGSRLHPSGLGSSLIGLYSWNQLKAPLFNL